MFFDQFDKLCTDANTTPTKFVTEILHLSSSKVTAWKNGSIPKYEILSKISKYFNVSIGTLFDGKKNSIEFQLNTSEQELLTDFKKLNTKNQLRVIERAKTLAEIQEEQKPKQIKMSVNSTYIETYSLPASAGTGVDLDGCEKEIIEIKCSELASKANFAVRISGDSMEPVFHNGDIALVKSQPSVNVGEIGIFIVNNCGYIKELGNGELVSLNPEYDNIELHEYDDIRCRGEVIGTLEADDIL